MSSTMTLTTENQYIGFGLKALSDKQAQYYCSNSSTTGEEPTFDDTTQTSKDELSFGYRIFTAGCYYIDPNSGKWLADGMDVLEDSTFEATHCTSTHLTDFAGGFSVLPKAINFDDVFANADFLKNPTIYTTIIVCGCIYIAASIWCFFMDRRDALKAKIHILADNKRDDDYFYEVTVLTGSRKEAGTLSNV